MSYTMHYNGIPNTNNSWLSCPEPGPHASLELIKKLSASGNGAIYRRMTTILIIQNTIAYYYKNRKMAKFVKLCFQLQKELTNKL